jgi:hypothetical protein
MFDRLKIGKLTETLDYPAKKVNDLQMPERDRRRGFENE